MYNKTDRDLRLTSVLAVGRTCLNYRFDGAGSTTSFSNCASEAETIQLRSRGSGYMIQVAPRIEWDDKIGDYPVQSPLCLEAGTSTPKVANCAATSAQTWEITFAAISITIKANNGKCLSIAANAAPSLETCDANTAQQILSLDPDVPKLLPANLNQPISTDYWDSAGMAVQTPNFSMVMGYNYVSLPTHNNNLVYETTAAPNALEFNFTAQEDGLYIFDANYSAPRDTGFDVYQDGVSLGRMNLRGTGHFSVVTRGGGGFVVSFKKGRSSKIRLENTTATPPLRLYEMRVSAPVKIAMPNFGVVNQIAASGTTTIPATQISDAYRLYLDSSNAADPYWISPWSYGMIEYRINVTKAGTYDLKFNYQSGGSANPYGKRILLDGNYVSTVKLPANTKGVASTKIVLAAGAHILKLHHPLYDLGSFGEAVSTGAVMLTAP